MSNLNCVVAFGNSITGSANCYPFQGLSVTANGDSTSSALQWNTPPLVAAGNILFKNLAVSGTAIDTGTDNVVSVVQTYAPLIVANRSAAPSSGSGGAARPTRKFIASLLPVSNDGAIAGGTVATCIAKVVALVAMLKDTYSFHAVILGTELPRATTLTEPNRLLYRSTLITPGWAAANRVDGIFDLAGDATMGNPATISNATYYEQVTQTHPTTAGAAILAPIWKATLDAAIAAL